MFFVVFLLWSKHQDLNQVPGACYSICMSSSRWGFHARPSKTPLGTPGRCYAWLLEAEQCFRIEHLKWFRVPQGCSKIGCPEKGGLNFIKSFQTPKSCMVFSLGGSYLFFLCTPKASKASHAPSGPGEIGRSNICNMVYHPFKAAPAANQALVGLFQNPYAIVGKYRQTYQCGP